MDEKLQEKCLDLVKKYKKLKKESSKIKCRNNLYMLMQNDIVGWIKSVLNKWNRYEDESEIISTSWDTFLFCLESYNPVKYNTPIVYFFFKYTKYWLFMHYAKKEEGIFLPLEEVEETLGIVDEPQNIVFNKLLQLYKLREVLPDEHKIVWDDAFMSLSKSKKYRYSSKNPGMSSDAYTKVKKGFKSLIEFILKE